MRLLRASRLDLGCLEVSGGPERLLRASRHDLGCLEEEDRTYQFLDWQIRPADPELPLYTVPTGGNRPPGSLLLCSSKSADLDGTSGFVRTQKMQNESLFNTASDYIVDLVEKFNKFRIY